jgi:hypothetical protein
MLKEHEEGTLLSCNHTNDNNELLKTNLSYISYDDINTNINTPTGP